MNPYGYFDESAREYVITRPDTPTPWINYLGAGRYGGIISNTAGGYSFDRDPRDRRVSRYRYNAIPADQPGRYIYLRDQETGEFWSPTWQPAKCDLDAYECRHGTAYTKISSEYRGISSEILYFVPPAPESENCPCELWVMRVRNTGDRQRRLRSFSYVELSFPDAVSDLNNLDWSQHIVAASCTDGTIRSKTIFSPRTIFFSSSAEPYGYDCNREVFVGNCCDLGTPAVVEFGEPSNQSSPRGNSIGSLCHELVLEPGEEREIVFLLGITDQPEEIERVLATYCDSEQVDSSFAALKADWDEYLSCFTVETPDAETNAMLNFWNQVQCRTTLYWSRFVSAYETGLGRGMGTRDSGQDTLGIMHTVPDHARRMLTKIWELQFEDGHTWHQFFPLTGEGGPGLAGEFPQWPQWFSDDHLWLVISVCAYLRETGDFAYLEQKVPYVEGGEDTIWGHMMRAIQFTLEHRGPHRLPCIGFSDWDDTHNIDRGSGKAESVFVAMQFCRVMLDMAELSDHLDRPEVDRFRSLHDEMAAAVNTCAWDGGWYARSFDDDGLPIGIASEQFQKISLNPQSWSVIGEVATPDRAEKALNSAHEKLNSEFGLALIWPPYTHGTDRVRGTSTFQPGAKENGGIFCHANPWAIIAAAMLGWGDRAFQYYRQILPLKREDADRFLVEPYVYCQNICGPAHPQFGLGRNAWLTGAASWTYVAGTQWILGIRPTYDGLRIAPALPGDWPGFSARRVFRGISFDITVTRAGKGNNVSLVVDGEPVEGDVVPLPSGKSEIKVELTLS
ncbi:MAG: glycosyl hydrolase family 65 protein [Gaiellaceae bacterium]